MAKNALFRCGLRNVADTDLGLREMTQVCKPGRKVAGQAELNCTLEMAALLKQSGTTARAKVTCLQGIQLAERLGNSSAKTTLAKALAELK